MGPKTTRKICMLKSEQANPLYPLGKLAKTLILTHHTIVTKTNSHQLKVETNSHLIPTKYYIDIPMEIHTLNCI